MRRRRRVRRGGERGGGGGARERVDVCSLSVHRYPPRLMADHHHSTFDPSMDRRNEVEGGSGAAGGMDIIYTHAMPLLSGFLLSCFAIVDFQLCSGRSCSWLRHFCRPFVWWFGPSIILSGSLLDPPYVPWWSPFWESPLAT